MAYPPAYVRTFSFTDYEVNFPGEPKPGDKLDTEYDNVANAVLGTQNALALIQRADGALANDSVGEDQLQDGILDGIADGITADAEAAAAQAIAAANIATSGADASLTHALASEASAGIASGAAAQAGVSQGIAQDAANEAALSAAEAATHETNAEQAANDTAGSVAQAQLHEEMSFKWAEYLTGPVLPAPPGWPEAVDDGMFSSKWWAIRARGYTSITEIDLGAGQPDIGDAWDEWIAIPGNEQPLGMVFATWEGNTYLLTDPDNPSDPASWLRITGLDGPPGPPNTLTIGTVTTGAPSAASITGVSPNQVLNLTLEQGPQGVPGDPGPPGSAAFADPTALLGLAAIPGVSAFAMRSDAAPALSQAIAPVWTAEHQFQGPVTRGGTIGKVGVGLFATIPMIALTHATAAANKKSVELYNNGGSFVIDYMNEAGSDARQILLVSPGTTGPAVGSLEFGNTTDNPTYTFRGTGVVTAGGVIRGPNGSLAAPTYSFTNDTNTGMYSIAADAIGWSIGGVAAMSLSAVQLFWGNGVQARPADGTAAAPIYSFDNDPDTGIYRAGANDMRLVAGGTFIAGFQLDGSSRPLFYVPDGSAAQPSICFGSDPNTGIWRHSEDGIGIALGGVERARFGMFSGHGFFYLPPAVQMWADDGSSTLPSIAFANDPDTGLYRWGADAFAATSGGNAVMSWRLGQSRINDGNAAAPAICFENDTNTGLYRVTTDTMDIVAGGVSSARFTTAGVSASAFFSSSARAIKRETGAPTTARSILSRLRPIMYRLLAGPDTEQLGLIAEEVRDVCPQLSDGKSVAYDRLAILLLAAWQDEHMEAA